MVTDSKRFSGSIPENYHHYMVPLLFEPYSKHLVSELGHLQGGPVLEIACGTGSVTGHLRKSLPRDAQLVATDISSEMLEFAKRDLGHLQGLELRSADAMDLPFSSSSFEAVICQFGIMFLPDKRQGLSEIFRVLREGGTAYVSTWSDIAHNELLDVANQAIQALDLKEPISFTGGCRYGDVDSIRADFEASGFQDLEFSVVTKRSKAPGIENALNSLVNGTTLASKLDEQDLLQAGTEAIRDSYRSAFGDGAVSAQMQAIFCKATKPD